MKTDKNLTARGEVLDLKRILIYRTGYLGDTLISLPAFWAVRKSFPDAHIALLSNSDSQNPQFATARNILPARDLFDEWLSYPTNLGKLQTLQSFKDLFLKIKRGNFDALIYLMTRNRNAKQIKRDAAFFRLAGIKNIIGTKYLLENYLDPNAPRPLPEVEPEADYLVKCLTFENFPLSSEASDLRPEMLLTEREKRGAREFFDENCRIPFQNRNLIAIAPASKWESKIWAEEKYTAVIERLIAEKNIFPVIFGGTEDREKGERLLKKWKTGANAAGILNIREAAAALGFCRLYLGNDTGTMHLAASVGTRCVAIFAAIDWAGRWIPFGSGHKIFRRTVECEGCLSPICYNKNKCLELVSTEEVFRACLEILEADD